MSVDLAPGCSGCLVVTVAGLIFAVIMTIFEYSGDDDPGWDNCRYGEGEPGSAQYERDLRRCLEEGGMP